MIRTLEKQLDTFCTLRQIATAITYSTGKENVISGQKCTGTKCAFCDKKILCRNPNAPKEQRNYETYYWCGLIQRGAMTKANPNITLEDLV